MKITYDEYIAAWQAPEAKESLDTRIAADRQKRYEQRMGGVNSDIESKAQLSEMSPTAFRSLRMYQMMQLLGAYKDANSRKNNTLLSIRPGTTDPDQIRRVVGDKKGYSYNDGILALDTETILAVHHISTLVEEEDIYRDNKEWANNLTLYSLEKVVDEMISTKGILMDNVPLSKDESTASKIYRETDIAKRAIGKVQTPEKGIRAPGGIIIEDDSLPLTGKNCFGIKDFELSWDKLMERKGNFFAKTMEKLFNFLERKIYPDSERLDPDRIGNKTIEIDTRGER